MFEPSRASTDNYRRHRMVLFTVILTGLTSIAIHPTSGADEDDAVAVVITRPEPAAGRDVELPGSFESYEQALLYTRVTGYVAKVAVDIGDRVTRGMPLVHLDIPEMEPALGRAQADVIAAEAALQKAQAQLDRALITHKRLTELQTREHLAVTQQDVDMAAADLHVAEAAVQSAEAEISVARAKVKELAALMAYAVIRAPFDGVVAQRFIDAGTLAISGADGGIPVLEVMRMDRLRLVLAVPEPIVPHTRVGVPVEITVDAYPGQIFHASVTRYAGHLTQDTRTMRTEIDMDDQEGLLRPGMYATVRLHLDEEAGRLSVPSSLVRQDGNGESFVWTIRDGFAEKKAVKIARDDGISAVIQTGLSPETLVVLETPQELSEGQPVVISEATGEVR